MSQPLNIVALASPATSWLSHNSSAMTLMRHCSKLYAENLGVRYSLRTAMTHCDFIRARLIVFSAQYFSQIHVHRRYVSFVIIITLLYYTRL